MGDKLQRGWADEHAKAQERHAKNIREFQEDQRKFFAAQARRELRDYLAEEAAEEAMLP